MSKERQEYKIVKCDARMRVIAEDAGKNPKRNWSNTKGEYYIRVFLHTDKSDKHTRHRNARKVFLPIDGDPTKPSVKIEHYARAPSGRNRDEKTIDNLILEDVKKFKENLGYLATVALDERQSIVKKPKTISDLWPLYKEYLQKRVSLKNYTDKLEDDTIQSQSNSFNRYLEIFGDHLIGDFPKNVENKFRELGPTLKKLTNPNETISAQTVRTIGGHLNGFFEWCSLEELITGRPIKLKLPPKNIKIQTAIPSVEDRSKVENMLKARIKEWSVKYQRRGKRTHEVDRYRTLLRIFMLGNYAGIRRGEIWSLPLRNIHLDENRIYIMPIDEDGGLDFDRKPIQVKFRPKAGNVTDFNEIDSYLMEFLKDDLESRKPEEKWFLDKGDGSLWYASPDGITKAITKVVRELGMTGGAVHWFRKARLDEIWEKSPNHAKQYGRHKELATTEDHYTSGDKPSDMRDVLNEINRSNRFLN